MGRTTKPRGGSRHPGRGLVHSAACGLLLVLCLAPGACRWVVSPPGEAEERAKAAKAGGPYREPIDKRPLPDLDRAAPLGSVLEYAFSSSGDLEAAYREWRGALERVPQAGALPDPRVDFNVVLGSTNIKSFSSVLQSIQAGVRQEVPNRARRTARAEQALAEATAAGEAFRAAKYALQARVTGQYAALAANRALQALTSETIHLFQETYKTGLHRYHAMAEGALGGLRKIEVEIERTRSEQRGLVLAEAGLAAALNGSLGREADRPLGALELPGAPKAPPPLPTLFERAVAHNASLAGLQRELEARGAEQVLADLERRPDYSFNAGASYALGSGVLMPELGVGANLPLNRQRIRAAVAEALARREAAEARYRAARYDTQARLVQSLAGIRDAGRVILDYESRILPLTRQLLDTQFDGYASGIGDLLDILDTQRLLVDFRKIAVQARSDRLRFQGELEELLGEDLSPENPAP